MSKEQLGEVMHEFRHKLALGHVDMDVLNSAAEIHEWLIEQAERVQELERQLKVSNSVHADDRKLLNRRTKQNKRYHELLEKIKEMTMYDDCREAEIYDLVSEVLEESE